MPSDLMPFQFNTHDIRIRVDDHDMPWWIATDVGAVLGHTNISVMMKRLDEDEKSLNSTYPHGPDAWFVNEFGLYKLLMGSRKPEAKEFQRWVTHEVLPQIRSWWSRIVAPMSQHATRRSICRSRFAHSAVRRTPHAS